MLQQSEKFYREMADRAWVPAAEACIEGVLTPNSAAVADRVAVFEAGAAIAILTRGAAVGPAIVAGEIFAIVGALTALAYQPGTDTAYIVDAQLQRHIGMAAK